MTRKHALYLRGTLDENWNCMAGDVASCILLDPPPSRLPPLSKPASKVQRAVCYRLRVRLACVCYYLSASAALPRLALRSSVSFVAPSHLCSSNPPLLVISVRVSAKLILRLTLHINRASSDASEEMRRGGWLYAWKECQLLMKNQYTRNWHVCEYLTM